MNIKPTAVLLMLLSACVRLAATEPAKVRINGYIGDRIDLCIAGRVMTQDVDELVEPFRHRDDSWSWKTEFIGKWMLGAIDSYRYCPRPELMEKIRHAAEALMATQDEDGYIGNYTAEARLTNWDIWGRKYTALSLLAYYRISGDKNALDAVSKSIDCLIRELGDRNMDIARTGNYFGMASCSILEPVVYLYKETGNRDYLEFAESIVESIEKENSAQLISKAFADIPVSERSKFPSSWWSFENGQKAYEMMSCYEGLVELGTVTGNRDYIEAASRTAGSIIRDEINVAGSGAAFECWYMGRTRQTVPTYHMMETCVTFTWMQFCARMLERTQDGMYADQFEKTMYNALMASMKDDGSQISKYSPLEGHRHQGEEQCGLHINCCNANGPRGFALIPQVAYRVSDSAVAVNLYIPSCASFSIGRNDVSLAVDTGYPVDGKAVIGISTKKPTYFTLALRVPGCAASGFTVMVNGDAQDAVPEKGYVRLSRKWKDGDTVEICMDIRTEVLVMDNAQAVVRGPVVFARDCRFADGHVDETAVIQCNEDGVVDAVPSVAGEGSFQWLDLYVPMVTGTNLEDDGDRAVKMIHFCDFASAGNDWDKSGRYRVWIPKTLHVMSEPYHRY